MAEGAMTKIHLFPANPMEEKPPYSDLPVDFGQAELMNAQLQKMVRKAEDIVSFAQEKKMDDTVSFLKKVWHPDFETSSLSE